MKWSVRLATISGIGVYVHVTFVLLLAWIAFVNLAGGGTIGGTVLSLGFVLAIFACVLFHEFGHALMARRFGVATRDITLLPIGGLARLERMPDKPRQELWVALAGPAVNLFLAAAFALLLLLTGEAPLSGSLVEGSLMQRLVIANLAIFAFNLIPAFPMDGGRILRALLASGGSYVRATRVAAGVGKGMALLLGIAGLVLVNPVLVFIALFVWIGAAQETGAAQVREAMAGIPVGRVMQTEFETLAPGDTLRHALERSLRGSQQDYPVVDDGEVVGILLQKDLLAAVAGEDTDDTPVSQVMRRDFGTVDPCEMLAPVLSRIQRVRHRSLPVVTRNGILVGVLNMQNVGEFLMREGGMERRRPGSLSTPALRAQLRRLTDRA
ncbi:hypothetical protein ABI59_12525 [Acidobacteria bacterium Mor1]|nr:hypothetical protein ABI59_12525 [Acidobacteria bacterium Mor1]